MATSGAATLGRVRRGWVLPLAWAVATTLGWLLYAIPVSGVHLLLNLQRAEDARRLGEASPAHLALAAALCGGACGLSIGLAQWVVIRRSLRRGGLWIVATVAGYLSIGVLPYLPVAMGVAPLAWSRWAHELVVGGKLHWLAMTIGYGVQTSWIGGLVALTAFGVVLGGAQWAILRGRVRRAGWWIAFSAGGWALAALLSAQPPEVSILGSWMAPTVAGAIGMYWLLGRHAPTPAG